MSSEKQAFVKTEKAFKEVKWVPVKSLSVVWAQSQRPLDERHAANIADNFDPEMFGVLSITKPNGHGIYHVIDGHHRKVAVEKLWGTDQHVPCQVFDAEDPARAAELFDHINTARKNPAPIDIFRVRVTAKSEVEMAINKIVIANGYTIGHRNKAPKNIACVASLKIVYQSYGPDTLSETLQVITAIWGPDGASMDANIIKGIGEFLSEYRNVDYKRLREVIAKKYTPARLEGAAKSYKELHGGTPASAIKSLIVATYNYGMRVNSPKAIKPKNEKK